MVDKDDILLKEFLQENKQEIADNGFSRRVMSRLPECRAEILSTLLTILTVILAAVLFITQSGLTQLGQSLREVFQNISFNGSFSAFSSTEPWTLAVAAIVLLFMGYEKLANLSD